MRSTAVALSEVVEFADESKRKGLEGTVYLQQKEAAQGGTSFSDEDASGGKAVEKIRLFLETTERSLRAQAFNWSTSMTPLAGMQFRRKKHGSFR